MSRISAVPGQALAHVAGPLRRARQAPGRGWHPLFVARAGGTRRASYPLLAAVLVLAGCARATQPLPPAPPPSPTLTAPIQLPRDAWPHDVLTEWWYYTGQLATADGRQEYGFEFTIFQGRREGSPPGYLVHFAVSDLSGGVFSQQARSAASAFGPGFAFDVQGWRLTSDGEADLIDAAMAPGPGAQPAYALRLRLVDRKPPVLQNGGFIDFGPAGGSYYYSRTRLAVAGEIGAEGGAWAPVTGQAWMDHQWGNFVVGPGGWDWFGLQLEDNSELMLYLLRVPSGERSAVYGSQVLPDGSVRDLPPGAVQIEVTDSWTSPHTNATYPSGWIVDVPGQNLRLRVTPRLQDQELYFPGTQGAGPVYWEGAVRVDGLSPGTPSGVGYVELTGYAR